MTKEKLEELFKSGAITEEEYRALDEKLEAQGEGGKEPEEKAPAQPKGGKVDEEALERLVQAKVDKITAKLGKEKAELQKKLDRLQKEHLSDNDLKNLEISEKEQELEERERALREKENRLYAIKAIKSAGLDDGSDKALELVEFVLCEETDEIDKRVKAFGALVKKFAKSEIDRTFKENGRTPNGAANTKAENNPYAKGSFNLTEQMRLEVENPELAKTLKAAAGK